MKRKEKPAQDGNTETMISTGSTALDLAISGGRVRGGGLPGGILVEIYGPKGCGKTVLLCEIGGAVQRQGGEVLFGDPEARLNKQFAKIFDLDADTMDYRMPDKVPELFGAVRDWEPGTEGALSKADIKRMQKNALLQYIEENSLPINIDLKKYHELKELKKDTKKAIEVYNGKLNKDTGIIHGILGDSLASLSTDLEMDTDDGDKMGMRRAKEFSEETRKTCRVITKKNYLMVCSNQLRSSGDTTGRGKQTATPGGFAIPYYSSVRIELFDPQKKADELTINGKTVKKTNKIQVNFYIEKNSCWKPYRTGSFTLMLDYGIDDIRDNLQYMKDYSSDKTYIVDGESFKSIKDAIVYVEENDLEDALKNRVIDRWEEIEAMFKEDRKRKKR